MQNSGRRNALMLAFCALIVFYAALVPVGRARLLTQVGYNEGWNVYNASTVAHHELLYAAPYGWTTVNYPALSFYIVAGLHSFTHDFLFTARALSLVSTLLCGVLAGLIVWKLTASRWSSLLTALFCIALFCADAERYVGMADPQMLAQVFFMAGLLVYATYRQRTDALFLVALLFVVGGNIKHSLLEFPLAALVDLWLTSRRKALLFCAIGGALAACSVALNVHFGGPYFLSALLAGRTSSISHLFDNLSEAYGPVLLPFVIAAVVAWRSRHDPKRRILALLFAAALLVSVAFGSGRGVWINVMFGGLLSIAMLAGLFLHDVASGEFRVSADVRQLAPVVLFGWLVIPLMVTGNWRPVRELAAARAAQQRFAQETAFLSRQDGPVVCESLLRCYYAQKPYFYDPFNATRLIQLGRLDPAELESALVQQRIGAVQMDRTVEDQAISGQGSERFDAVILQAIQTNYVIASRNEDGAIYVPRQRTAKVGKPALAGSD
jgi:hypothetical protein